MARTELTDAQWEQLRPLLPPQKPRTGRPSKDHRTIISGILWILRTGAPWRDLPERYDSWKTFSSRFYRWQRAGVWWQLLKKLQQQADGQGKLDWSLHYVDSTVVRAHQHAAGAKGGQEGEALGRSRGGFGTKVHVRAEGEGKPLVFMLTGGERHEQTIFESLMERGVVRRAGRGRPRIRPERLVGDKGYSTEKVRDYLRRRGIAVVMPHRADQLANGLFDRRLYRERNRIERLINRLKQFRRIATRYEKRAANYLAMLAVAAMLLWL